MAKQDSIEFIKALNNCFVSKPFAGFIVFNMTEIQTILSVL